MKSTFRRLGLGLVSLAGAALLLVLVVDTCLGSVAKMAVEEMGSRYLGVRVSLRSFSLSPFAGRATIQGLRVANPPGYSASPVVEVDRIDVSFDTRSLFGSYLKFGNLGVQSARVNWEGSISQSNFSTVQANLRAALADQGCTKSERKVAIGRLAVQDTRASVRLKGASRATVLKLSDIEMEKIGTRGKGLPGAAILGRILEKIATQTAQDVVKDALIQRVADQLPDIHP